MFKCIQFPWAHLPCQAHLDIEPVHLEHSESPQIYTVMNTGDWGWNSQDQLLAGETIVPVICASDKTHFTNCVGDQHVRGSLLTAIMLFAIVK